MYGHGALLSVIKHAPDNGVWPPGCRGGLKSAKPARGFLGARVGFVIRCVLDLIFTRRSQGVLEKLDPLPVKLEGLFTVFYLHSDHSDQPGGGWLITKK